MMGRLVKKSGSVGCALFAAMVTLASFALKCNAADAVKIINLSPGAALHMREAPDKNSKVLAYIPGSSKEFRITGSCDEKWCPISFRGMKGWAFRRFLRIPGDTLVETPSDFESSEGSAATTAFPGFSTDQLPTAPLTAPEPDAYLGRFYSIEGATADHPLSLRDAPDDASPIRGFIPHDARQVEGLKRCIAKWCLVRYNGVVGWTLRRHLADDATAVRRLQVVNIDIAAVLPVKEYPGDTAADIGFIPSFASGVVQIGACDKTWCHVRYLGFVGWVSSRYIALELAPKL
ncbi:MAG: SH3 domain-containing protein [Hyphomicrobiales bacterium]|nr:SH3 domain-containing protein [Hyphomicrobiales bacterium]